MYQDKIYNLKLLVLSQQTLYKPCLSETDFRIHGIQIRTHTWIGNDDYVISPSYPSKESFCEFFFEDH